MNVRAKLAWLQSHIVHEDSTKEVQGQPPASQQNVVRHTARVENYLRLKYLSKKQIKVIERDTMYRYAR
jgi:hypothetical protein